MLADGTIAQSGGKVVKNVAGYDLGKLFTGSFGSLGVIAECTFRLHPPAAGSSGGQRAVDDPADAARRVAADRRGPDPLSSGTASTLTSVFESIESAAEAQAGDVAAVARRSRERRRCRPVSASGRTPPVLLKVTHRLGALREVLGLVGVGAAGMRRCGPTSDQACCGSAPTISPRSTGSRSGVAAYDGSVRGRTRSGRPEPRRWTCGGRCAASR